MYACVYVCVYVCMYVCTYVCMYVCTYASESCMLTNIPAFDGCADANARSNARLAARSCVLHQRLSSTFPVSLRLSSLAAAKSRSPSAFFLENKFVTKRKNKKKSQRLAKKGVFKSVLLTFFRAVLGNHEKKKREKKNKTLLRRVSKTQSLAMLRVSSLFQKCSDCRI